jgi:hypothetical protein
MIRYRYKLGNEEVPMVFVKQLFPTYIDFKTAITTQLPSDLIEGADSEK